MQTSLDLISDKSLMSTRICDLSISVHNLEIEKMIKNLYLEIEKKGFINFYPKVYLGDEWFSPEKISAISIPFYLAHPRLKKIEKKIIGYVEGGSKKEFLKLLRHEAGHCLEHAFEIKKNKEWMEIFGNPRKKYDPDNYIFNPHSKDYVINLKDHYAQAHPDEDFAETFAVWLEKPKNLWKKEYKNQKIALKKLNYMDKICHTLMQKQPTNKTIYYMSSQKKLRSSLKTYYNRRVKACKLKG